MIALLAIGLASAGPGVLRAPGPGHTATLAVGWPDVGLGGWISEHVGLYGEASQGLNILEAGLGGRTTLAGETTPWGVDLLGTAGLFLPRVRPTVGLALTPALRAGARSPRAHATLGLVTPIAWAVDSPAQARLETLGELRLGLRAGPVWLSAQASLGPAFVPGSLVAIDGTLGGAIGFQPNAP